MQRGQHLARVLHIARLVCFHSGQRALFCNAARAVQRGNIGNLVFAVGQGLARLADKIGLRPVALVPAGARLHALQAQQKLVEHIGIAVKIEQVGKRVFHQRADMLHAVAVIPCAQGVKAHFKIAGVQVWVLFCSQVKQVDALGHRGAAKGQVCPWAARQLRHLFHVEVRHARIAQQNGVLRAV